MDKHDFEQWCARRDPQWYLKTIDELMAWLVDYKQDECLATGSIPKYALQADMAAAKQHASKPQLSLF